MSEDNVQQLSKSLHIFGQSAFDRLIARLGLGGSSRRQVVRRALFLSAVTWLPLLILSWIGTFETSLPPKVTFYGDFSLHVRFLVALPILIAGETFLQARVDRVIPTLLERELIGTEDVPVLARAEARIRELATSLRADLAILAAALAFVLSRSMMDLPQEVTSWRMHGGPAAVIANHWYRWFSLVVYNFVLFRWVWRYLLWSWFLVRVATLRLDLQSHHPDLLGGLGFLLYSQVAFGVISFAVSAVLSANLAERIVYIGQELDSYEWPLIFYLVIVALVYLLPLLAFSPMLVRTKREGLISYGDFGQVYARRFDGKWLSKRRKPETDPLGSPDIQSLNDLMGSFGHLREMRLVLATRRHLIGLTAFAVAPLLPLLLTKVPLVEVLKVLAKAAA